jgi:cell division protein FtsN
MKKQRKLILSILTVFFLTLGVIGVTYGFSGEEEKAPTTKQVAGSENSVASMTEDKEKQDETKAVSDDPSENENEKEKKEEAEKSESTTTKSTKEDDKADSQKQAKENGTTEYTESEGKSDIQESSASTKEAKPETKPKAENPTESKAPADSERTRSSQAESKAPAPQPSKKPAPAPKPEKEEKQAATSTVTYSIVADSQMGTVLPPTSVEIEDGDTVLDVLIEVTKSQGIPMSFRGGTGANAYVEGINNLFEFDRGPGSGWMYRVNGIFPNRGAGVVPLQDGDRIEWLYTIDLGKDLGAELKPFR